MEECGEPTEQRMWIPRKSFVFYIYFGDCDCDRLISGSEGCPPLSAWQEHARAPHWIPFNAITSRVPPRCVFFSFLSLKDEDFVLYLTPSHVRWEWWGVIGSRRCRMSGIKSVCMFISNALYVLFAALQCWSLFLEFIEDIV